MIPAFILDKSPLIAKGNPRSNQVASVITGQQVIGGLAKLFKTDEHNSCLRSSGERMATNGPVSINTRLTCPCQSL